MKKIILLIAFGSLLISCDASYDGPNQTLETIPVSQVTMPSAYAKDSITEIPVNYIRPTACHSFFDFYYERNGLTRTVAVIMIKENNVSSCPVSQTTYTIPVKFKPIALGTYHFKFWKGTNSSGVDEYFEYDAVVNH